jgi:hypothetical protein
VGKERQGHGVRPSVGRGRRRPLPCWLEPIYLESSRFIIDRSVGSPNSEKAPGDEPS